jgi:hypothetical protein
MPVAGGGEVTSVSQIKREILIVNYHHNQLTPWLQSASELYRQSDRRMLAKLVPTFADRGVSHGHCSGSPTAVISFF